MSTIINCYSDQLPDYDQEKIYYINLKDIYIILSKLPDRNIMNSLLLYLFSDIVKYDSLECFCKVLKYYLEKNVNNFIGLFVKYNFDDDNDSTPFNPYKLFHPNACGLINIQLKDLKLKNKNGSNITDTLKKLLSSDLLIKNNLSYIVIDSDNNIIDGKFTFLKYIIMYDLDTFIYVFKTNCIETYDTTNNNKITSNEVNKLIDNNSVITLQKWLGDNNNSKPVNIIKSDIVNKLNHFGLIDIIS